MISEITVRNKLYDADVAIRMTINDNFYYYIALVLLIFHEGKKSLF